MNRVQHRLTQRSKEAKIMSSFPLNTEAKYYVDCLKMFETKSGEFMKNTEILQEHIPASIQRMLPLHGGKQFNILSVGSGDGEKDLFIVKISKDELQKSEKGRFMKIFNRAIEPNAYSCGLYKAAIENLRASLDDQQRQQTEFEICQQTFQEYQGGRKESIKFDMVHFIHSTYFFDLEQTLKHCFEKKLRDKGHFVCIVAGDVYWVSLKQRKQWQSNVASEGYQTAEKLIQIANENGWKHEVHTQEYSIDVTEVFDPKSSEGNRLLDFLTHTVNFRETAEEQLVEETLALIRDRTTVKDGKRLGEKKESLVVIYKK